LLVRINFDANATVHTYHRFPSTSLTQYWNTRRACLSNNSNPSHRLALTTRHLCSSYWKQLLQLFNFAAISCPPGPYSACLQASTRLLPWPTTIVHSGAKSMEVPHTNTPEHT
ncbi:unnamed protein product, partial [Ectocarpus sp. 12 AP-2014]